MRVAILSESPADEIAVRILADSILGLSTQLAVSHKIRSRGWPAVLNTLPAVIRQLHYTESADGLIVVADSDDTPLHETHHDSEASVDCRLCQLRKKAVDVLSDLPAATFKVAIGIAVPAIEAWYLFPTDARLTESTWRQHLGSGPRPDIRRNLKKKVYGTELPSQTVENQRAEDAAKQLISNLHLFEQHFPNGFGPLAQALRSW
ncbi:MAG: hypothetical protein DMG16_10855 [Acidobacteria bacterium]|nr:MAG: hypothetical protein DMG16_10855 [Acidobacteriota bacterium]